METKNKAKYVVVDVETADRYNTAICSIGFVILQGGKIIDSYYSLINPQCDFCERNISIHRITPDMVKDSITIKDFWYEYYQLFTGNVLIAHNAKFDLNVLYKDLQRYDIDIKWLTYIDTLEVSRKCLHLDSYRLNNVCDYLGIPLENHHCAIDDCTATATVFIKLTDGYTIKQINELAGTIDFTMNLEEKLKPSNQVPKSSFNIQNCDYFSKCPDSIEVKDKKVCLSGNFYTTTKGELTALLQSMGCEVKKSVTKKLDYLIVGEEGNSNWKGSNFGTKILKALEHNLTADSKILILKESDFLKAIDTKMEADLIE